MSQVRYVGNGRAAWRVYFGQQRFAVEERLSIVPNEAGHCRTGFYYRAGSVRVQHDVVEFGEARINRQFIPEYIECRAGEAMVACACCFRMLNWFQLLPVTVSNACRDVQNKRDTTERVSPTS